MKNWLLHPIGECNLHLFALVSLWISSKIHDSPSLSVKNFKSLGDNFIKEQHFTMGDILEAEIVLMQEYVAEDREANKDVSELDPSHVTELRC
ncbi:cyclin-J18-like [Salvia miltiorrhiza]|uniref:cyclin-J18-like n=1 Tax=Salvia miltiorrhiza TaxID=226208 RepID=UPI0025AC0235|nr:cyclin-J18-like [Salvia miltiorrhiza]